MGLELMYCTNCHKYLPWSEDFRHNCCFCHDKNSVIDLHITTKESLVLLDISKDEEFLFAMDKLKQDDIVEFNLKMAQFRQTISQEQPSNTTPKCPTCGSTNIKKISATKRWASTGILGIASSDMGKTMQCNDCGNKW